MNPTLELLTPAEEAMLASLWEQRRIAENELWKLQREAKEAVQKRNAQARKVKALSAKWLPLAERKYQTV